MSGGGGLQLDSPTLFHTPPMHCTRMSPCHVGGAHRV
jgi:hypothetical protein